MASETPGQTPGQMQPPKEYGPGSEQICNMAAMVYRNVGSGTDQAAIADAVHTALLLQKEAGKQEAEAKEEAAKAKSESHTARPSR